MFCRVAITGAVVLALGGCPGKRTTGARVVPTPTIQVGSCGEPGRDGIMSASPELDRADRDLNSDGSVEAIVVDRSICTPEGNCHWNIFVAPPAGSEECARYVGTFLAAALEPLSSRGDNNMIDVRGYYNLHGGRMLLESYRFARGGYRIIDALVCRRAADDRLECTDHAQGSLRPSRGR